MSAASATFQTTQSPSSQTVDPSNRASRQERERDNRSYRTSYRNYRTSAPRRLWSCNGLPPMSAATFQTTQSSSSQTVDPSYRASRQERENRSCKTSYRNHRTSAPKRLWSCNGFPPMSAATFQATESPSSQTVDPSYIASRQERKNRSCKTSYRNHRTSSPKRLWSCDGFPATVASRATRKRTDRLSRAGSRLEQTVHPVAYGEAETILRSQFKTMWRPTSANGT